MLSRTLTLGVAGMLVIAGCSQDDASDTSTTEGAVSTTATAETTVAPPSATLANAASRSSTTRLSIQACCRSPKYSVSAGNAPQTVNADGGMSAGLKLAPRDSPSASMSKPRCRAYHSPSPAGSPDRKNTPPTPRTRPSLIAVTSARTRSGPWYRNLAGACRLSRHRFSRPAGARARGWCWRG